MVDNDDAEVEFDGLLENTIRFELEVFDKQSDDGVCVTHRGDVDRICEDGDVVLAEHELIEEFTVPCVFKLELFVFTLALLWLFVVVIDAAESEFVSFNLHSRVFQSEFTNEKSRNSS